MRPVSQVSVQRDGVDVKNRKVVGIHRARQGSSGHDPLQGVAAQRA
jgi:hypothetical protein